MLKFFGLKKSKPLAENKQKKLDPDREEDGFLLVGETASERSDKSSTTWYTNEPPEYNSLPQVNCNQIPVPDKSVLCYSSMGANQSTRNEAENSQASGNVNTQWDTTSSRQECVTLKQDHFIPPQPSPSLGGGLQTKPAPPTLPYAVKGSTVPACHQEPVAPRSVYEDIPFIFHPVLELQSRKTDMGPSPMVLQKPNMGRYHYDFSLERSTLKCNGLS